MKSRTSGLAVALALAATTLLLWPVTSASQLAKLETMGLKLELLRRDAPEAEETRRLESELEEQLKAANLDRVPEGFSPAAIPWRLLLGRSVPIPPNQDEALERLSKIDPTTPEAFVLASRISEELEPEPVPFWRRAVGLALVWGLAATALWTSRFKKEPVERIKRATLMLGSGQLGMKVDLPPGSELFDLAKAFNTMSDELSRSQAALVKAKKYNESILASLQNMVIVLDRAQIVQSANPAALESLGYSAGELIGKQFLSLVAPRARRRIDGQTLVSHAEAAYLTKSGEELPVLFSSSALPDEKEFGPRVVTVAQDIRERKRAEEKLSQAQRRLAQLVNRLIESQESERRLVANDLHDGVLQYVIAANMHLKAFRKSVTEAVDNENLEHGLERLREAVTEGRRLIFNLRPSMLDDFGLLPTLQKAVKNLEQDKGCEVAFDVELGEKALPPAVETTAYRIIQEALNNIAKHCQDGVDVELRVRRMVDELEILVSDTGPGFKPAQSKNGIGLSSMRERAELLGGTFELETAPEKGTRVEARLPFSPRLGP